MSLIQMDCDTKFIEKVYLAFKQAIWDIFKNTDKNRNFVFMSSELNISLNFTFQKYITCYISLKNSAIFYLIF